MTTETITVRTLVETAVGCPYGLAGETAILANDDFINRTHETTVTEEGGLDNFFARIATASEADDTASDIAQGILDCETCHGNPHDVDLKGRVCAFALEACTGITFLPKDVRKHTEYGKQGG